MLLPHVKCFVDELDDLFDVGHAFWMWGIVAFVELNVQLGPRMAVFNATPVAVEEWQAELEAVGAGPVQYKGLWSGLTGMTVGYCTTDEEVQDWRDLVCAVRPAARAAFHKARQNGVTLLVLA